MTAIGTVLLIEDNPGDARLLREMLREPSSLHIEVRHAATMTDGEIAVARGGIDVILLDLGLLDAQGLEGVRRARLAAPRVPLVVLTGCDDELLAAQALQRGAQDYLVKGQIESRGLLRALRYAIERMGAEEALHAAEARAQLTLDCIGDAVICTDLTESITFLNAVAETMTGWSRDEAMGRPMHEVCRMLDATSREPVPLVHRPVVPGALAANRILVRRDGFEIPIEDSVARIQDRGGGAAGAVIVFRDVSVARAMSLQMVYSAQHDYLTGLPNRLFLKDRIDQAIILARRHKTHLSVLYLDLDGFKHINDSLGHPVGDLLLRSVSKRLVDSARTSDTVSRQGGDEFVVLLAEMRLPEEASVAARRMLEAVALPHAIDGQDLHVTTSIGVSVYPEDGEDAETLIKNADTAMYQAKENGRQRFQYFKPEMNTRAIERQFLEENLRRALERRELSLSYQPKIDFRTGAIVGSEALLRWNHPTRGAIAPAEFIPVAEACGLIRPIGNWVLREACTQARLWTAAGLPATTMAVNVSAVEFRSDDFLEGMVAALSDTGMDPELLEVELTESVLMKHAESATKILRSLRDQGVKVAVDDFGTGYSSLSYLQTFPIDALKIDQSFVSQIVAANGDAGIVTAVIHMAQSLKLRVVAEGVETFEQMSFLRKHECDEAQGYFFSRPVPPDRFAALLASNRMPRSAADMLPLRACASS